MLNWLPLVAILPLFLVPFKLNFFFFDFPKKFDVLKNACDICSYFCITKNDYCIQVLMNQCWLYMHYLKLLHILSLILLPWLLTSGTIFRWFWQKGECCWNFQISLFAAKQVLHLKFTYSGSHIELLAMKLPLRQRELVGCMFSVHHMNHSSPWWVLWN